MLQKRYETERLVLQLSQMRLAASVSMYTVRNKEFLRDTEPEHTDTFFTIQGQRDLIRADQIAFAQGNAARFWIAKKDKTTRVIGMVRFSHIIRGAFQSCFLGYKLDKDEINQGYMTEALALCVEIAFEELGLHRLEANVMPHNHSSLRVLEKLDFANEGLSPRYLKINGVWQDHIHMVRLNESREKTC